MRTAMHQQLAELQLEISAPTPITKQENDEDDKDRGCFTIDFSTDGANKSVMEDFIINK